MHDIGDEAKENPDDLTREELKWIAQVQRVFAKCPSKRLGCYTIGDGRITFFNEQAYNEWESVKFPSNRKCDIPDLVLALQDARLSTQSILTPMCIQGVCG